MTRSAALLGALLTLPGCALFHQAPPPMVRPGPAEIPPAPNTGSGAPSPGSIPSSASVNPGRPTPAPLPAPVVQSPAPTPVPTPAPSPPPSVPAPPPPSPPLTASLSPLEARRLQGEAQRRIESAERLLRQLEARPLAPKELETLRLAQSLVDQARRALVGEEYERAANLAAKAQTLADDLRARP